MIFSITTTVTTRILKKIKMPSSLGQGNGKMQTEYNHFQISSVFKHVGILKGRSEKGVENGTLWSEMGPQFRELGELCSSPHPTLGTIS